MKIGKILAMAAVATVFASCSNEEELANVGKSESNAIRFAGISGLSDTRTTPIGTHNLTSTNFDVMAFMGNALFMGGKARVWRFGPWRKDCVQNFCMGLCGSGSNGLLANRG